MVLQNTLRLFAQKLLLNPKNFFVFAFLFSLAGGESWGQTILAGWTFPTTSGNAPSQLVAECGNFASESNLYADGSNGSTNWSVASSKVYFGGNAPATALCSVTGATGAYSLVTATATPWNNNFSIVFKIPTTGFQNLILKYDTRGTTTGFSTHNWAYGTNGTNFTNHATITGRNIASFSTQTVDFSAITALNNQAFVYIRLTVSGATTSGQNNRFDNINFTGTVVGNTVTFNSNYGTPITTTQTSSTTANLNGTFTRTGYTLSGWSTNADGTGTQYTNTQSYDFLANLTLYAKWSINNYNLIYDGNGSTGGTVPATQNGNYNSTLTVAGNTGSLFKTGFAFNGWNTLSNGSGTSYASGETYTIPATNQTLYAVWAATTPAVNTTGSLSAFSSTYGTASSNQSFSLSGINLTTNVVVTPPTGFEVSTDGSIFSGSVTLTPTSGTINSTTIFVRLKNNVDATTYSGNVTIINTTDGINQSVAIPSSTVAKKTLTITGISIVTKEYDGNTSATISGTPLLNTIIIGDDVTISGTPTAVFTTKIVGNNKATTISGYTLAGTKATNYTLTQPTVSGVITAKPLTVSGAVAQNKVYDTNTTATISGASLIGIISGDTVTVSGGGTFASANVGTGIVVTPALTLSGTDATNYTLTQPSGLTANITKATPVITTSTISISAGGTFTLPSTNIISTSSESSFTYSISNGGFATLSGTVLTGVGAGTETLTINQPASANYFATSATVSVVVSSIIYTLNDYQTASSGTWSTATNGTATWEKWNGTQFVTSSRPTTTNSNVYIRHNITTNGSSTVASLIVENGADYTVTTGTTTVNTLLLIKEYGTMKANNTVFINSGAKFEIEDYGSFTLNYTATNQSGLWAGDEIFHPLSNFTITEWSANTSTSANRPLFNGTNVSLNTYNGYTAAFGNIDIDLSSSSEPNSFFLIGSGVNANLAHSNVTLLQPNSVGNNIAVLSTGTATSGIGGNFIVDDLYSTSQSVLFANSSNLTFDIGGDLQLDGSTTGITPATTAINSNITVNGDVNITAAAILDLGTSPSTNPNCVLNIKGNLNVASSGILRNSNTSKVNVINFNGTAVQTIDIATTSTFENRNLAMNIKSGANVKLINRNLELGTNSKMTVENGGTLDFGFNGSAALNLLSLSGQIGQTFDVNSGGTIKITSKDGVTTTAGVGNVQVPTTGRTYNPGAIYHYIGKEQSTSTDQMSGNGLPNNLSNKIIVELDTDTVTFQTNSGATAFTNTGTLEIRKGTVIDDSTYSFTNTSPGNLTMTGGRYKISKTGDQPPLTGVYSLTGGVVEFANINATPQNIRTPKAYQNIEVTGNNVGKNSDDITLNNNGTFTIKNGGVFEINSNAIVGPTGIQTVTVETGGTFRTGDQHGFSGSTITSINSDIENIILQPNSTVEYSNDSVTNQIITKFDPAYRNLLITNVSSSFTCTKILADTTTNIAENLILTSGKLKVDSNKNLVVDGSVNTAAVVDTVLNNITFEDKSSLVQQIDTNTNPNTGSIFYKRNTRALKNNYDFVYWSMPTDASAQTVGSMWMSTAQNTYYKFSPITAFWVMMNATDKSTNGVGFIARSWNGSVGTNILGQTQTYSLNTPWSALFYGVPNSGNITVPVLKSTTTENLIGNPYPCAIDLDKFYQDNSSSISPRFYFWVATTNTPLGVNYNQGDFGYYVSLTSTGIGTAPSTDTSLTPDKYLDAAQGFVVFALNSVSTVTGTTVTFKNSHKTTGNNNSFFKTMQPQFTGSVENHNIWLNIYNGASNFKQQVIQYAQGATNNWDELYDITTRGNNPNIDFYSINTYKFTLQSRPLPFNINDILPLGYRTNLAGTYTISIDHTRGLFGTQVVYLEDLQNNIIHNLSDGAYSFATATGTFDNRFRIRFTNTLNNNDYEANANKIIVSKSNSVLDIKSLGSALADVTIYDIQGKIVYEKSKINSNNLITSNIVLQEQVLMVKVTLTTGESVVKKIKW